MSKDGVEGECGGGERTDAGLVSIALREARRTVASWRPPCLQRNGGGEPRERAREPHGATREGIRASRKDTCPYRRRGGNTHAKLRVVFQRWVLTCLLIERTWPVSLCACHPIVHQLFPRLVEGHDLLVNLGDATPQRDQRVCPAPARPQSSLPSGRGRRGRGRRGRGRRGRGRQGRTLPSAPRSQASAAPAPGGQGVRCIV